MLELTIENFDDEVIKNDGIVLVDFWGEGCQPCLNFMPIYEELAKELSDKVKFCKVNTTHARKLAISQRIMLLPTIVLYKNGERVDFARGSDATREGILQMLEKNK